MDRLDPEKVTTAEAPNPWPSVDRLYRDHASWLRRLLMKRFRALPVEVEDILQETWLRLGRQTQLDVTHPKALLSQIALNLYRDHWRRELVRADHRHTVQTNARRDKEPQPGLSEQEATLELSRLVNEMPETYRDVFALSRFGHMMNKDIATHLGISVKTVEWRMGKALEFCMSRLKD